MSLRSNRRHVGQIRRETKVKFERGDHIVHHDVVRPVTRDHRDVGASVDRIALFHQRPQRAFGIGGLQQGTMRAAAHAAPQHIEIGLEPDRQGRPADRRTRLLVDEGAAAGGDDARTLAEQARHDPALAGAEIGLAVLLEDLRDGHAGRPFDLRVGIDELEAETAREASPRRGLAAAHKTDEHDGALPERLNDRGRAAIARRRDGRRGRNRTLLKHWHASRHCLRNSIGRDDWNVCFRPVSAPAQLRSSIMDRQACEPCGRQR